MEDIAKDMDKDEPTSLAKKEDTPKANATKSIAHEEPKNATKSFAKKEDKPKAKKNDSLAAKKTVKKEVKSEDQDIPMDAAAIKAYSSVIADAAEESEPQEKVIYTETMTEEKPSNEPIGIDPMGSMLQNEISSIKEASVKAAAERDEWVQSMPRHSTYEMKTGYWLRQRLNIAAYLVLTNYI